MVEPRASFTEVEALVDEWANRFGFGHYNRKVTRLPKPKKSAKNWSWANCVWLHEDEFFEVWVIPDVMPLKQAEGAVIHEFAHGLLELAKSSGVGEEIVCNRIVRLLRDGDAQPNVHFCEQKEFQKSVLKSSIPEELQLRLVSVLVDGLSPRETEVMNALYWEGVSLRTVGERLGVSPRQVGRIRDLALVRLHDVLVELDEATTAKV